MVVKCGVCGKDLEIGGTLQDGAIVKCPFCNEETMYKTCSRIEVPVKPKIGIRRPARMSVGPSSEFLARMERLKGGEEVKVRNERARRNAALANTLAMLSVTIIVVGALVFYWKESSRPTNIDAEDDSPSVDERAVRIAGEEADRAKRKAELDAERERRRAADEAEREKKRLAREKELEEKREKAEAEKENHARIEAMELLFKTAPFVFAADFPEDKSPLRQDGGFLAIGVDYVSDRRIYEAMVEKGNIVAVRVFSPKAEPVDVNVKEFSEAVSKERFLVKGDIGPVWIFGTGKPYWMDKVSIATESITPYREELKGLSGILQSWGRIPEYKYRLSLKPVNSGNIISLGIIGYGDSISSDKIRDALLKPMQARREKSANISPPKFRKFKPNVVMYDGNMIRKEMNGITKVPRKFKYHYHGNIKAEAQNRAKAEWGRLKREAERQELEMDEVRRENERLQQEYEAKVRAILEKAISGEEIETEASKYRLLIERSRSKLPK